jgi:ChaB
MLQSRRYCRHGNELPATLRRSCQEAQDTFTRAYDSAVEVYGEGDQADRAAFMVLKEKFEKRGDPGSPGAIPETDTDRFAGSAGLAIGKILA